MAVKTTVKIDESLLDRIPDIIQSVGHIEFLGSVQERVKLYVPRDTEAMLNANYIVRNKSKNTISLCYGSPFDDEVNEIVIRQSQVSLHHFGLKPSYSMRGYQETGKGMKWVNKGLYKVEQPLHQKEEYQRGYQEKKELGLLTKYKSEFLKHAVEDAVINYEKYVNNLDFSGKSTNVKTKTYTSRLPKGVL